MLNSTGFKERDLLLNYSNGEDCGWCLPMTYNFLEKQHHIRKAKIAEDVQKIYKLYKSKQILPQKYQDDLQKEIDSIEQEI